MVKPNKLLDALTTWINLNALLMSSDLATAEALLAAERAGKKRKQFMLRIHSRLNRLRAAGERQQLIKKPSEKSKVTKAGHG